MNFQDAEAVADFHQAFLKRFHLLLIGAVCNFKRSVFIELVRGAWRGLVGPRLQQQFGQNVGRNDGTPRPARIMLPSSSPIRNVPAGQHTIVGWHERVGERAASVRVEAGRPATVDLTVPVEDLP